MAIPFTRETTAEEVVAGVDLTGKKAVVTGGASGIGTETARVLAKAGAEVTVAIRNTDVDVPQGITAAHLDLSDLASVRKFAESWAGPLDILVNNAGVMALPELTRTPDGWELQFATNHIGHFALAYHLRNALQAANGRIVSVSSNAHRHSPVTFEDINFENRPYDPWVAYGQSKTANILFAVEVAGRWPGITANALHPGAIHTSLQRHVDVDELSPEFQRSWRNADWKTVEQGAATSVLLAASPLLDDVTGRYFEDVNAATAEPYALDPENAKRLWDLSEKLVA